MKRLTTVLAVVALALVVVGAGSARILPPNANAHGAGLGGWAKGFFVFDASLPVVNGSHPALDEGDVDCSLGQSGKVWFLETAPGVDGPYERRCSVPSGTALYVPVFQWVCSPDLDGIEVDPCLADTDAAFAAFDLGLSVDGVSLDNAALDAYRATTGRFDLPLVEDGYWELACDCELGSSMDFGADVIGALVGPLSVGEHTIVISYASEDFGFEGSLTYRITVTPRGRS